MAHKLKEFARELQEKAKGDGLKESLRAGKELEKLAQQGLDKKSSDEQLEKQIAGAAQKLADAGKKAAEGRHQRQRRANIKLARFKGGAGSGPRSIQ